MYSRDLRRAAMHAYTKTNSLRNVAALLNVCHTTVMRWLKSGDARVVYPQRASKGRMLTDFIRQAVTQDPFMTTRRLATVIRETHNVSVSRELVRCVLKRTGVTLKKAKFFGRPHDVAERTLDFVTRRDALLREGRRFVSLDETAFGRHHPAVYGYAPRGQQLYMRRTPARITTTSVLAAVSSDGQASFQRQPGSYNTSSFLAALETFPLHRDTVVLLDNVSFHHARAIKDFANQRGLVLLYVPPYSPWFNPVEGVFSVAKRHYYRHGSIDAALAAVTPQHVMSFFAESMRQTHGPAFSGPDYFLCGLYIVRLA